MVLSYIIKKIDFLDRNTHLSQGQDLKLHQRVKKIRHTSKNKKLINTKTKQTKTLKTKNV